MLAGSAWECAGGGLGGLVKVADSNMFLETGREEADGGSLDSDDEDEDKDGRDADDDGDGDDKDECR